MTPHQLAGRIEDLDLVLIDPYADLGAGISRERRVIRAIDLNEAGVIDGARAWLEVAKALGGQRSQMRLLSSERLYDAAERTRCRGNEPPVPYERHRAPRGTVTVFPQFA
ncbi:MAG TPA: hypothetical protein VMN60_11380 [Longimicrobiales bacterium]|nr:hypothetical protein [Longimicrobiales bacterium]